MSELVERVAARLTAIDIEMVIPAKGTKLLGRLRFLIKSGHLYFICNLKPDFAEKMARAAIEEIQK
jgi:hypothetical protein